MRARAAVRAAQVNAAHLGADPRSQILETASDRLEHRRVTALPAMEVALVTHLVASDRGHPRIEGAFARPLELLETKERLEQRRLQDVLRLDLPPQLGPQAQADEGQQAGRHLPHQLVHGALGAIAGFPQQQDGGVSDLKGPEC